MEQGGGGDGDEDLVGAAGLLDRVDVQDRVGQDRVAQGPQRQGPAPLGEVLVDIERDRALRPVLERGALGTLHGAGLDVQPVRQPLDLRDRSRHQQRRGPGGGIHVHDLHIPRL